MKWEQIEGKWEQLKGHVQENWGKLTDDDLAIINGQKEQLIGKLRERYGYASEQADRELEVFMRAVAGTSESQSKTKNQPTV